MPFLSISWVLHDSDTFLGLTLWYDLYLWDYLSAMKSVLVLEGAGLITSNYFQFLCIAYIAQPFFRRAPAMINPSLWYVRGLGRVVFFRVVCRLS